MASSNRSKKHPQSMLGALVIETIAFASILGLAFQASFNRSVNTEFDTPTKVMPTVQNSFNEPTEYYHLAQDSQTIRTDGTYTLVQ